MDSRVCNLCSHVTNVSDLRPYNGGWVCAKCKWQILPKCSVINCKTPVRKQKILKNIPARVTELAPAARLQLNLTYGLSPEIIECCSSCYQKLHRAASAILSNASASTEPQEPHYDLPKPGRPPTPYEKASKTTQKKIERSARQIHLDAEKNVIRKLNTISHGSGNALYEKVVECPPTKKVEF